MGDQVKYTAWFFMVLICMLECSCSQNTNSNSHDRHVVVNDTSELFDDDMLKNMPDSFTLDTIRKPGNEQYYHETVIVPRLTNNNYMELNRKLQKEIVLIIDSDIETTGESYQDTVTLKEDTSETDVTITPLTIYKGRNLVSYGFLNIMVSEGMMRPFRRYFSINYNTDQNRFIYFDDYFIVTNPKDSATLKWIIYGDIGSPDLSLYGLGNHLVFSSDNDSVYFYFDMFGFLQNPMGIAKGIKKKYIKQFIRKEYQ